MNIKSPLEDLFDIERGTTESIINLDNHQDKEIVVVEQAREELPPTDVEDELIKKQLGTVYDYAIETFESQSVLVQTVDPTRLARTSEVAAEFLRIALDATSERAKVHHSNKKLNKERTKSSGDTTNNNLIIADRNEILRIMEGKRND